MGDMNRLLQAVEELTGLRPPGSIKVGGQILRAEGRKELVQGSDELMHDFVRRALDHLGVSMVTATVETSPGRVETRAAAFRRGK